MILLPKSVIKPGKFLASGTCGEVFEVEGMPEFVVKTPIGYVPRNRSTGTRKRDVTGTSQDIKDEIKNYNRLKLSKEKVFIPSKAVKLGKCDATGKNCLGILRPKVTVTKNFTYSQLEVLRKKIVGLSKKGFILSDGVQAGLNKQNMPVLYDTGFVKKGDPEDAFVINQYKWERFVLQIGKSPSKCGQITM